MRILIIDDSEPVRRGVARLLAGEPDWLVCGEAQDGSEGIQKALQLSPDLVLLDVSMPGLSGWETTRRLRQELCGVKILILSQQDSALLLPRALQAGAQGCVDKSRLNADLVSTIKSIEANGRAALRGFREHPI
jgi:two-component system, NarL family, response regulator NreC